MSTFGTPAVMYAEKFFILWPIVWILDNWMEDEDPDLINFVKLTIFVLGFGPRHEEPVDSTHGWLKWRSTGTK